jgi:Tfp pilus assembly protein PilO
MKELVNKLISSLHFFILLYGLYGAWVMYDEHSTQLQEISDRDIGLDDEIARTQKKVKEIQEFSKKTDVYKLRVEEVAKSIESVQKQLPAETNDTQILSYFQSEINSLNIKDANFTPGKEEKSTYYISKEYSLKGKGTFLQFLIFLERIGKADRIYNIKELKLANLKERQKGRFQLISGEGVIQAFRYNPDFRVDRGF